MSELVNKVAEILNAPVDLVQRSAEARAAASGVSVDEVLNSWAGGESVASSAPKEEEPLVEETAEEVVEEIIEETAAEEVVEEAPVEKIKGVSVSSAVTRQVTKSLSFANEALIKTVGDLRTAPDLSTNNTREPTNNPQWLKRYLKDSTSVNRDIPHPSYTFVSESDLDYLITYLLSLGEVNE